MVNLNLVSSSQIHKSSYLSPGEAKGGKYPDTIVAIEGGNGLGTITDS